MRICCRPASSWRRGRSTRSTPSTATRPICRGGRADRTGRRSPRPGPPMSELAGLGARPAHVTDDPHFGPWFSAVADRLLNGVDLIVAGDRYRFAELEAYYFGENHPDTFTHREP